MFRHNGKRGQLRSAFRADYRRGGDQSDWSRVHLLTASCARTTHVVMASYRASGEIFRDFLRFDWKLLGRKKTTSSKCFVYTLHVRDWSCPLFDVEANTDAEDSVIIEITVSDEGRYGIGDVFEQVRKLVQEGETGRSITVPTEPMDNLTEHGWVMLKKPRFANWRSDEAFTAANVEAKLRDVISKLRRRGVDPAGFFRLKIRLPATGEARGLRLEDLDRRLRIVRHDFADAGSSLRISYDDAARGSIEHATEAADAFIADRTNHSSLAEALEGPSDDITVTTVNAAEETGNILRFTSEQFSQTADSHPVIGALKSSTEAYDDGHLSELDYIRVEISVD